MLERAFLFYFYRSFLFFYFERELADGESDAVGKLTHLPPGMVYSQGNPRSNIQVFKYR